MRELKFRAWDIKCKRYVSNLTVIKVLPLLIDKEITEGLAEVEQYTGLKDKNGKEIYEGDIFEDDYNGGYEVVKWIDERSAFCLCYMGYERDVEGFDTRYTNKMEVIGNIHENPELLGKEK